MPPEKKSSRNGIVVDVAAITIAVGNGGGELLATDCAVARNEGIFERRGLAGQVVRPGTRVLDVMRSTGSRSPALGPQITAAHGNVIFESSASGIHEFNPRGGGGVDGSCAAQA